MKQVKEVFENIIEIQKSKFIGVLIPITSVEEIKDKLNEVRKLYPKATHYCYGYIYDQIQKSNDDGEPSSTAGKPILETLLRNELNHVLLVVVRYFGGIKLGAGGLLRAYVEASSEVIKKATLFEEVMVNIYQIDVQYSLQDILKRYFVEHDISILEIHYEEMIKFIVSGKNIDVGELKSYMNGKIDILFIQSKKILQIC